MTFKTFLAEATILEGGAAIKGSHPLTQAEAREIGMQVVRDLKVKLNLPSTAIALVGSAGLKAADQLSGDIDVAVEADVTLVKTAVEQLALNGQFRHMPGLNVYSFAKLHGSKIAQVDIIPTTNLKLAKWAYYNDPNDLKLGLKGSHRNELLFAIAKYAEYKVTAKTPDGKETARSRLAFDLSRGLYRSTQDKAGKRGITKSYKTTAKALVTNDPDKICGILFGTGTSAKQVMNYDDAFKLMMGSRFPHKEQLPQILQRAIEGLESKKLVVPADLRQAAAQKVNESTDPSSVQLRKATLHIQQALIERLGDDFDVEVKRKADDEYVIYGAYIPKRGPNGKPARCLSLGITAADVERINLDQLTHVKLEWAARTVFTHLCQWHDLKTKGASIYFDTLPFAGRDVDPREVKANPEVQVIYVEGFVKGNFVKGRFVVKELSKFGAALEAARNIRLTDLANGHEQIFEAADYSRNVLLTFQQELIDYYTPVKHREFEMVEMTKPGVLTAKLKGEYDWKFVISHAPWKSDNDATDNRVTVDFSASGGDFDSTITYVMRIDKGQTDITIFTNGGMLANGNDAAHVPTWDDAIRFFFREITLIFKEQGE